ncbi:MAG TPA: hypothetical protein VHZ24_14945 [Pirellulales bacterium]|jgi:hypothetical protein|nr:hypothetical protein [Pirellulales bacterium]
MSNRWTVLVTLNIAAICVLGLFQATLAQNPPVYPPFNNAVDMQLEIVTQLKELNRQVREQNNLLRSGQMQVVVAPRR